MKRPQPQPPHTRGTFHRRLQPFYAEKQSFVLRLPPQHKAHATFMQPLQCVSQHHVANLHVSMHMATPDDNKHAASCSHSSAICNLRFKTRIQIRTGTTTRCRTQRGTHSQMKRPQPQPPHAGGYTFHRRQKPLYTEKHKVLCSGFLPDTSPMQHSCSHYNAFRSITLQTCTYLCT